MAVVDTPRADSRPNSAMARRVGIVAASRFPAPRGSQVHIGEMATALAHAGEEVHLVAPLDPRAPAGIYQRHPLSRMAKFRPRPSVSGLHLLERPFFDALLVGRLFQVVRQQGLEILHAHNYEALAASLLVRGVLGVKVVYHAHNVAEDELPLYSPSWLASSVRASARRMDGVLPAMADAVVALSPDVRDHLVGRGVSADRIWVIPPGLDTVPFQSARRQRRMRSVVFAGNCDGYQNLQHLFRAWEIVAARDPKAELRVVTHARGAALKRWRSAGLADRIRFVEAHTLSEVADELGQARVGVSPRESWSGFPIKNLNYMAAGLPTVALAGSAKGVRDGATGWVVPSDEPEDFASCMIEALAHAEESSRRGAAAYRQVLHEHCWTKLIDPLLECSRVVEGQQRLHLVPPSDGRGLAMTDRGDFSLQRVSSERFPL
jgi:glycosyltransferase involved in cell wall biosynthesis